MLKHKIQDILTWLAHFLQKQPHGRALVLKLDSFMKQDNQAPSRNQHMNIIRRTKERPRRMKK
jgi:hypothetical protein